MEAERSPRSIGKPCALLALALFLLGCAATAQVAEVAAAPTPARSDEAAARRVDEVFADLRAESDLAARCGAELPLGNELTFDYDAARDAVNAWVDAGRQEFRDASFRTIRDVFPERPATSRSDIVDGDVARRTATARSKLYHGIRRARSRFEVPFVTCDVPNLGIDADVAYSQLYQASARALWVSFFKLNAQDRRALATKLDEVRWP